MRPLPITPRATLRDEAGAPARRHSIGDGTILSRIWNKPAVTVIGIDATSVAAASNTLLPEVTVVISARVAPGQTGQAAYDALESHLRAHAPFGAGAHLLGCRPGGWLPRRHQAAGRCSSRATRCTTATGFRRWTWASAVSIPFIADLVREFPAAQILVTRVEDPHSRAHSPQRVAAHSTPSAMRSRPRRCCSPA